jgi:hypothetical protein
MVRTIARRSLFGLLVLFLCLVQPDLAATEPLTERLAHFPSWQGRPQTQTIKDDLVYPDWFLGDWSVETTLVDLAAPLAPDIISPGFDSNRLYLNQPIVFAARFLPSQLPTQSLLPITLRSESAPIVADRAFNGFNLAQAYLAQTLGKSSKSPVLAVKVDPTNPNRQITLLRGDRQLISTVTGRTIETPAADQFVTSEVFQQEFRGMAQPYFNTVETTTAYWHCQENPRADALCAVQPDQPAAEIVADQVTAIYLSPQDPDYFKASDRPVALYRYQLRFST